MVRRLRLLVEREAVGVQAGVVERPVQPVVLRLGADVLVAVERHADDDLVGGYTARQVVGDGADRVPGPVGRVRVARVGQEQRVRPRDGTGRDVEVVRHDVDPVELGHELPQLVVLADLLARRQRGGQQVVLVVRLAERVELAAELLRQQRRVVPVGRPVVDVAAADRGRVLPVDVDAVEDARGRARTAGVLGPAAGRQVALDERVDARGRERLPPLGGGGQVGEPGGLGPAAEHVRVGGLELAELVEVAEQVLGRVARIVGHAVDGVRAGPVRLLEVRPRVEHAAADRAGRLVEGRQPERVLDDVQLVAGDVLDVVPAPVDVPVGEVGGHDPLVAVVLGLGCRRARGDRQSGAE